MGEIASEDGTVWTAPAANHFETAPKAADLMNQCGGDELSSLSQLELQSVPVMDAGGSEEFVAYIFADNYFELYVNGELLAVDPVPFTPFNSNVVRFKADRPLTIAVQMVDWEERLGLGSEDDQGKAFQAGDGGFVAHFQDANGKTVSITDENWRAQTFYTAPLKDQSCLVEVPEASYRGFSGQPPTYCGAFGRLAKEPTKGFCVVSRIAGCSLPIGFVIFWNDVYRTVTNPGHTFFEHR